jgi:hypothetical protein
MIKHVLEINGIYFVLKTIFFVGKKLNTVMIFNSQLYMISPSQFLNCHACFIEIQVHTVLNEAGLKKD